MSKTQPIPNKLSSRVYQTIYPVYTCASDGRGVLITTGGGGSGRHGVKNMIQCHLVDESCTALLTMATLDTGDALPSHLNFSEAFRLYSAVLKDQVLIFSIDEAALFKFHVFSIFSFSLPSALTTVTTTFTTPITTTPTIRLSKIFSHKGSLSLLIGLDTGEVQCYRMLGGSSFQKMFTLIHSSPGKDAEIVDVDFRSDGEILVTCAKNGTTKIWDVSQDPVCKASLNVPNSGLCARACRFVNDAQVLVAYYGPRGPSALCKFSLDTNSAGSGPKEVVNISGRAAISAISLSADNKTALVGYAGGNHEVWDVDTMRLVKRGANEEHEMPVTAVALFGKTGGVTGSADFTVRLLGERKAGWASWVGRLGVAVAVGLAGFFAVENRFFVL